MNFGDLGFSHGQPIDSFVFHLLVSEVVTKGDCIVHLEVINSKQPKQYTILFSGDYKN